MSVRIGIMQGRLLPPIKGRIQAFPKERWPEEFPLARDLGFDCIEFIFDECDDDDIETHPLLEENCRRIQVLVGQYGVGVTTVCADYFIRHPFHHDKMGDVKYSLELLSRLIKNSPSLGVTDIVLPCVDQSTLVTASDRLKLLLRLMPLGLLCEKAGVNIALETDLPPSEFRELIDDFGSSRFTVNYDVGNSASLGYTPVEDWEAYGERVSSVHIKDRLLGGPTVPLGTGSARLDDFFRIAREKGYQGLFVIQGARGADNVATAYQYKKFVEQHLKTLYGE